MEPTTDQRNARNILVIKILSFVIIILVAILVAPYIIIHNNSQPAMDMSNETGGGSSSMSPDMMLKTFELGSTTASIPTISFTLNKDSLDGWDLHITTTNFTFTPQNINTAPIADEGHVHLYIDGTLYVVFGPWYHIESSLLPPGRHIITVSLNANDHSTFTYDNEKIQATHTLIVSPL